MSTSRGGLGELFAKTSSKVQSSASDTITLCSRPVAKPTRLAHQVLHALRSVVARCCCTVLCQCAVSVCCVSVQCQCAVCCLPLLSPCALAITVFCAAESLCVIRIDAQLAICTGVMEREGKEVFFLKHLYHARQIRNRALECFERASNPTLSPHEVDRSFASDPMLLAMLLVVLI